MTSTPLLLLSEATLSDLRREVSDHVDRYASGGFWDLAVENGWAVESSLVHVDIGRLAQLDVEAGDIANSLVVHQALKGMTPALAMEERIWARLTHLDCLEYTRGRWLAGKSGADLEKAILNHVFAPGRTGIRDDNAISRLWWNFHIAGIADPADPYGALNLIAKTTDFRQSFVERPGTASRPPLARAIVRAMRRDGWIASSALHFRRFMKVLNRHGGGILLEALPETEADQLMDRCSALARAQLSQMVST